MMCVLLYDPTGVSPLNAVVLLFILPRSVLLCAADLFLQPRNGRILTAEVFDGR